MTTIASLVQSMPGALPRPWSTPQGMMLISSPTLAREPLTVTAHDANLLRFSADFLPIVTRGIYPQRQDIHAALYWVARVLDPMASREYLLDLTDHALLLFAEYLVTRRGVHADTSVAATLDAWICVVTSQRAATFLLAAARDFQLRLVFATRGPEGLRSYLTTGIWPADLVGRGHIDGLGTVVAASARRLKLPEWGTLARHTQVGGGPPCRVR